MRVATMACALIMMASNAAAGGRDAQAPSGTSAAPVVQVIAILRQGGGGRVMASYYGRGAGEKLSRYTSDGEVFDPYSLTAAHRTLPFGTRVRVTYGDRSVVVRIADRGPAAWTGRAIDITYGAALRLGLVARGVGLVTLAVLN